MSDSKSPHRREFLAASGAVASAAMLGAARRAEAQRGSPASPILVDTHLHCFAGQDDPRFPYHDHAPYRPAEAATPQHLLKCMDDGGIDFAIVVHPEPYQDDHRYLKYCLEVGRERLKGTLLLFADRPGSVEGMPALVKQLDVVSARIHAYAPDRLPPLGRPELRNLWKQATDHGLAIQLHFEPRYAPGFEPLIREFHDTRVIIDHMGRPLQGTSAEHDAVVRWSRFDNTIMKLSSLPSARNYPHRDIQPIVKQLTAAFGPERMIYGGGFSATATGQSYAEAFQRARSLLAHLSSAEQNKILGQNAARLFGFSTS